MIRYSDVYMIIKSYINKSVYVIVGRLYCFKFVEDFLPVNYLLQLSKCPDGRCCPVACRDGSVDSERCAELIALAKNRVPTIKVTFHRGLSLCFYQSLCAMNFPFIALSVKRCLSKT
mgnify:CR=1 FL=1